MEINFNEIPFFCSTEFQQVQSKDFIRGQMISSINSFFLGVYKNEVSVFSEIINDHRLPEILNCLNIIKQIKHPSIISFNSLLMINNQNKKSYFIKYNINTAKGYLSEIKNTLPPASLSKITYGIISAISYLHSIGIIHNDISLENVLIDEDFKPYLVGFQGSIPVSLDNKPEFNMRYFNFYKAPEYFNASYWDYSTPVDVFAFGMLLYQIMNKKKVINFNNNKLIRSTWQLMKYLQEYARPVRLPQINDNLWSLITFCWAQEPNDRPAAEEIQEVFRHDRSILFDGTDFKEYYKYVKNIDDFVRQNKQESWEYNGKELFEEEEDDGKSKYNKIGIIGKEIDSRFIVQEVLGRGAFAEVYKVFDQEKNIYYAKKTLLKNDFQTTKDMIKEYEILDSLDYISIEKIIGMSYPTDTTEISLYMEYLSINLETAIKTNILSNTDKVRIIIEILFGMQYLVDHNILHRDLKSNNIMLTENCKYSKICDFGSSTFISKEDFLAASMTKGIGTLSYMSPEMLNSDEYDWRTDVYSFGILFYYIIYGNLPQQKPADKLHGKRIRVPISEEVNEIVKEIIMKCTVFDPKKRPSFIEVINTIHINDFKILKNVNSVKVNKRYIKLKEAFEKR